jgi:tetratricopeptide (TPR) repeat protein
MNKVYILLCSLLFMSFFAFDISAQTMKINAVKPFNDGLTKSKKGNYKAALAEFETALKYDTNYQIYYRIGFAQMKLKNTDEAIKNFTYSIKANPKFDSAYNNLGNVYYRLGRYQEAIKNFDKVLELSRDDATRKIVKFNLTLAYTELASTAENDNNCKKAIRYLKKALSYDNYDVAYLALARNYVQDSQYTNAIYAGFKALKYKKYISAAGPDYYIGVSYNQKSEIQKAKEYLNLAKNDPVYKSFAENVLNTINK